MADLSGFFEIEHTSLDGTTPLESFDWSTDTVNIYRQASVLAIGTFPVNAFTRAPSVSSNPDPIAREGALIVARLPGASNAARIGVVPFNGSNVITQAQSLSGDPTARLWTFPGDRIYVREPLPARGRLQLYVRPLNFREIDQLLKNPQPTSASTSAVETLDTAGDVPYTANTLRTVYLVSPPAADTVYTLPAAVGVSIGDELVFVGMNGRPFVLSTPEINGATTFGDYYVPAYGTLSMIGYGGGFASHGAAQDHTETIAAAGALSPWRGTRKIVFDIAANSNVQLPSAFAVPNDAQLLVHIKGAGTITIQAQVTQNINSSASLALAQGKAAVLRPAGANWIGVNT